MLEGISLKSISNMVGADKLTAQALLDEKTLLVGELLKSGPSKFLFDNVVNHSVDTLISKDFSKDSTSGLDELRGLRIEKRRGYLTKLTVERIYFKSATAVTELDVTISDGVNEKVYQVTADANEEVVIEANYHTSNLSVDITYQNDSVEPYIGTLCPYNNFVELECRGCQGSKSMKIRTIEGEELLIAYRGIRVDASVMCDREKMVCLIADSQKLAILYLVGAELMRELIFSDRINFLTLNKELAKEKLVEWENKGHGILFENSQGIRNMLTSKEKACFICNSYKYGYSKP